MHARLIVETAGNVTAVVPARHRPKSFGQRPGDAADGGATKIFADRPQADPARHRDLPLAHQGRASTSELLFRIGALLAFIGPPLAWPQRAPRPLVSRRQREIQGKAPQCVPAQLGNGYVGPQPIKAKMDERQCRCDLDRYIICLILGILR